MEVFSEICLELGVPLATNKTEGPQSVLVFLGLEIDTIEMKVRIPKDKLDSLKEKLLYLLGRKKATLKELQSLAGSLSFCCRAIPVARAFIRRFYDAMCGIRKRDHFIRITMQMKEDIEMWLLFLDLFNGCALIPVLSWISSVDMHLFTDSAGGQFGCASYLEPHWCFYKWPIEWMDSALITDITFLELVPIVLAFLLWEKCFQNKKLILHTDNLALVSILNKKNPRI